MFLFEEKPRYQPDVYSMIREIGNCGEVRVGGVGRGGTSRGDGEGSGNNLM